MGEWVNGWETVKKSRAASMRQRFNSLIHPLTCSPASRELVRMHHRRTKFAHDDAGRLVGNAHGTREIGVRAKQCAKGSDHGVACAGHIVDLASLGGKVQETGVGEQRHSLLG